MITEQENPDLWTAVVAKHLPEPDALLHEWSRDDTPRFIFGVGEIQPADSKLRDWSGMAIQECWTFERVHEQYFQAVRGSAEHPHFILGISRPSAGAKSAWVHAGGNPAPLIGSGENRVWLRQEDGNWVERVEVGAMWSS